MRSDQTSLNTVDLEALVSRIFAELTGVESVSAEDNFFDLGGHSLLAIRLVSRIRKETGLELPLRSIFETATPAELASILVRSEKNAAPFLKSGEGKSADGHLVLSWGQRRLWALDQIEGNSAAYNVALAFRLTGSLNQNVLAQAIEVILKRHSSLRTIVGVVDERPVGMLVPTPDAEALLPIDISPVADTQNSTSHALARWVADQISEPFDLSVGLQFRARLYRQGPDDHALILLAHHAAADGISMSILAREISTAYSSLARSAAVQLPKLPVSYSDYAAWQEASLNNRSAAVESQIEYWRTRLAGAPELLSLPTDQTRNADRTRHSGFVPLRFDSQMAGALEALAREHDTTVFVVLLAGFAAMLSRLASQGDVVIGAPVSNRNHVEIENLVGFFVNTLALRIDLSGDPNTATLIDRCRERVVSALSNQDVPFERLVDLLSLPRSLGHTPLFQAMFEWQLQEPAIFSPAGLAVQPLPVILPRAKYDLTLCLEPRSDRSIEGGIEYDATLFNHDTVYRWAAYLEKILRNMIARSALPVNSFRILSDSERCQILQSFNQTEPIDTTNDLISLFRHQVSRAPDDCAVVSGNNRSITYFDLDRQSERYARRLAEAGIGHDDIVAIALDRSIELMIVLLAVIKAGAAFLPIDPDIPTARQLHMLQDSGARLLVTRPDSALSGASSDLPKLLCQEEQNTTDGSGAREALRIDRRATPASENLAYVIYTSGSAGAPKGVEISYGSLSNLLFAMKERLALGKGDKLLAVTTFGFDIALLELLVPILSGARLLLASKQQVQNISAVRKLVEEEKVTFVQATPTFWNAILAEGPLKSPKLNVLVGGEALNASLAAALLATSAKVINLYGPTETTVWSTVGTLSASGDGAPSIGRPINNTQIYVLDKFLELVPQGVVGEIYIAGSGLAQGYHKQRQLTAECFVACPFGPPGSRMFRTGDLGSWRSDGTLEFHGRTDDQVKIRGFRVELFEIEARLMLHADVVQAAVALHDDQVSGKQLVAYWVPRGGSRVAVEALRSELANFLPDYMLPSTYVEMESLPLSPNGKIDRRLLFAPKQFGHSAEFKPPRSTHERLLCKLFSELTGSAEVGVDDNFFNIGGHSLLAIKLVARLRKELGLELPLRKLFERPSPSSLAAFLDAQQGGVQKPAQDESVENYAAAGSGNHIRSLLQSYILTATQNWSGTQSLVDGLVRRFRATNQGVNFFWCANSLSELVAPLEHLSTDAAFYGLRSMYELVEVNNETVGELAALYADEMMLIQPTGPFQLGGYCLGGMVALEIARLLTTRRRNVETLVLVDVHPELSDRGVRYLRYGKRLQDFWRNSKRLKPRARFLSHLGAVGRKLLDKSVQYILTNEHGVAEAGPKNITDTSQYIAQAYSGKICLIFSDDSDTGMVLKLMKEHPLVSRLFRRQAIPEWINRLQNDPANLQLMALPGGHERLIHEEPYIQALAEQIDSCIRHRTGNIW